MKFLLRSWAEPVVISSHALSRSGADGEHSGADLAWCPPAEKGGPPGTDSSGLRTLLGAVAEIMDPLLEDQLPAPTRRALVLGSQVATFDETMAFASGIETAGPTLVSPALFPLTVMNSVAGYVAIDRDFEGPNITLCDDEGSLLLAFANAADLITTDQADLVLTCGFEAISADTARAFGYPGLPQSIGFCSLVSSVPTAIKLGLQPEARIVAFGSGQVGNSKDTSAERTLLTQLRALATDDTPTRVVKDTAVRVGTDNHRIDDSIVGLSRLLSRLQNRRQEPRLESLGIFASDEASILLFSSARPNTT